MNESPGRALPGAQVPGLWLTPPGLSLQSDGAEAGAARVRSSGPDEAPSERSENAGCVIVRITATSGGSVWTKPGRGLGQREAGLAGEAQAGRAKSET